MPHVERSKEFIGVAKQVQLIYRIGSRLMLVVLYNTVKLSIHSGTETAMLVK